MAGYWTYNAGRRYWVELRAWDEWGNECRTTVGHDHRGQYVRSEATHQSKLAAIRENEELLDAVHYTQLRAIERQREIVTAQNALQLTKNGILPQKTQPQAALPPPTQAPLHRDEKIIDQALLMLRDEMNASNSDTTDVDEIIERRSGR